MGGLSRVIGRGYLKRLPQSILRCVSLLCLPRLARGRADELGKWIRTSNESAYGATGGTEVRVIRVIDAPLIEIIDGASLT
jgi:hypothetical protein